MFRASFFYLMSKWKITVYVNSSFFLFNVFRLIFGWSSLHSFLAILWSTLFISDDPMMISILYSFYEGEPKFDPLDGNGFSGKATMEMFGLNPLGRILGNPNLQK